MTHKELVRTLAPMRRANQREMRAHGTTGNGDVFGLMETKVILEQELERSLFSYREKVNYTYML
jgi:hypothetical protein